MYVNIIHVLVFHIFISTNFWSKRGFLLLFPDDRNADHISQAIGYDTGRLLGIREFCSKIWTIFTNFPKDNYLLSNNKVPLVLHAMSLPGKTSRARGPVADGRWRCSSFLPAASEADAGLVAGG
jgi:hypothetical protein